jgi:hypothetical protein
MKYLRLIGFLVILGGALSLLPKTGGVVGIDWHIHRVSPEGQL